MRIGLGLGLTRLGGGFSPATLFAASEPGVWYDPSDLSTLFQDDTLTQQAEPGDDVAAVTDRSPSGLIAAQTTPSSRMTLDQSGRYFYLSGDATADTLVVTLPDLGADATIAYATESGVTLLTGQTVGAGAYSLPLVGQLYGFLMIDRALTVSEAAHLSAWLDNKTPDFLTLSGDMTDGDDILIPSGDMNTGRDLMIAA